MNKQDIEDALFKLNGAKADVLLGKSRRAQIALTKIEEAIFWLQDEDPVVGKSRRAQIVLTKIKEATHWLKDAKAIEEVFE
jgi:hypothetical protein